MQTGLAGEVLGQAVEGFVVAEPRRCGSKRPHLRGSGPRPLRLVPPVRTSSEILGSPVCMGMCGGAACAGMRGPAWTRSGT
eukprot:11338193-Alexandrium_andersonii.AAC.1